MTEPVIEDLSDMEKITGTNEQIVLKFSHNVVWEKPILTSKPELEIVIDDSFLNQRGLSVGDVYAKAGKKVIILGRKMGSSKLYGLTDNGVRPIARANVHCDTRLLSGHGFSCLRKAPDMNKPEINIGKFFNDSYLSDITIFVGIDNIPFYGHKIVLVQKSDYFAGLFRSSMEESFKNESMLLQFDPKDFMRVFKFMYGLSDCMDSSTIGEYAAMAEIMEYLQIEIPPNVTESCGGFLDRTPLTLDSAVEIIESFDFSLDLKAIRPLYQKCGKVIAEHWGKMAEDKISKIVSKKGFFTQYVKSPLDVMESEKDNYSVVVTKKRKNDKEESKKKKAKSVTPIIM
jgi:hypothetical protein